MYVYQNIRGRGLLSSDDYVDKSQRELEDYIKTSDQKEHKLHKDQPDNKNLKREMRRTKTVRIFQMTNVQNLIREEFDIAKKRKH